MITFCCVFWGEQLQIFTALFSLSILVSEIINLHLQSRKFQHDGIHIPVNSLSLISDRSSHGFNHNGQLFPSSEFSDNPGQSLIQSAEYLLSWCRKGRYPQCPPRKEPQDIRFATSPTHPTYIRPRTSRRDKLVPQNPDFSLRRWYQLR